MDVRIFKCFPFVHIIDWRYTINVSYFSIKLDKAPELVQTVKTFNEICQQSIDWSFEHKDYNKVHVHKALYQTVRTSHPNFPSALIQTARDVAVESVKRSLKHDKEPTKPIKKELSSIRFDQRTMKVFLNSGSCQLTTMFGRLKYDFKIPKETNKDYFERYEKYSSWNVQNAQLKVGKNACYLLVQVFKETPEVNEGDKRLGIDRGITNIAVCSDNTFYNAKHLKNVKGKYRHLKAELQAKGTRSAKRKLKQLSGRERRFVKDVNHCLSKKIVNKPCDIIVLEDLTNIRMKTKRLGSWSFCELQNFIEYKAEQSGKRVVYVDPRYTSQTCSKCGHVEESNRKNRKFKCKSCGFELDADLNASRNIATFSRRKSSRLSSTNQS